MKLAAADATAFRYGVSISTDGTQPLLGFFNATEVAQQTGDVVTALSNLGLVTSGTVAVGNLTGGAALTKADDTNVTLTLGGTPATALLVAASITAGWAGTLAATRGGTGTGTYTLGDLLYSSAANTLAKLAGNTTATRNFLRQTGTGTVSAAPVWDTIVAGDVPNLDASKITTGTVATARLGSGTANVNTLLRGDQTYGDYRPPRSAQTANFTAATTETRYSVNASGGTVTATLPAAASNDGLPLEFWHNVDPGANTLIIDANASETINGALTLTLYHLNDYVALYCDGVNWHVRSDNRVRPVAQVKLSADQAAANATVVTVAWNAEDYDPQGMHDTVTNNSRVTVKRPGKYLVFGFIQFEGATTAGQDTGVRQVLLYKTGAADIDLLISAATAAGEDHVEIIKTFDLGAADYIEIKVYQDSGNSRKVMSQLSRMSVTFLAD